MCMKACVLRIRENIHHLMSAHNPWVIVPVALFHFDWSKTLETASPNLTNKIIIMALPFPYLKTLQCSFLSIYNKTQFLKTRRPVSLAILFWHRFSTAFPPAPLGFFCLSNVMKPSSPFLVSDFVVLPENFLLSGFITSKMRYYKVCHAVWFIHSWIEPQLVILLFPSPFLFSLFHLFARYLLSLIFLPSYCLYSITVL